MDTSLSFGTKLDGRMSAASFGESEHDDTHMNTFTRNRSNGAPKLTPVPDSSDAGGSKASDLNIAGMDLDLEIDNLPPPGLDLDSDNAFNKEETSELLNPDEKTS